MPNVELDTDMIQGKNLSGMSPEEVEGLFAKTEEKVMQEIQEQDATLTLGGIGSPYNVGPIDCTIAIGNLVLLNEINSPFITGDLPEDGEPLDTMDCIKSLYVLGLGKEALKPIMAMKQRIQAMMMIKPMVVDDPDLFDKVLDRIEKISSAEVEFTNKAVAWYEDNFVGHDFQEVIDGVMLALSDLMKIADDMPVSDSKKK